MKERDSVPACKPAILNKERYLPKYTTDQYIHTNTSTSFVKSLVITSQCCTWGTAGVGEKDIINYR